MCDCAGICLCLIASAFVSYYTCSECIHYKELENNSKEPK